MKANKSFLVAASLAAFAMAAFAQNAEWYGTGGGKEGKTFHISTEDDLKGLAQLVNSGFDNFSGKTIILNADITLEDSHIPIGNSEEKRFMGIFDGNEKTISGLSISGVQYAGLLGYVGKSGLIKNITVNVSQITTDKHGYAGGLAGRYASTNAIENCRVNIKDSISASYSGGLIGYTTDIITITNSHATGNVSGGDASNGSSGGLVGYAGEAITITNSYATGNVSGSYYAGGLLGNGTAAITNSYATGNVSSSGASFSYSGGLVGEGRTIIASSYATGNISSSNASNVSSGGLLGNGPATIANSYATGNVSSSGVSYASSGGLVGSGTTVITDSYATGSVASSGASDTYSGGLVGRGQTKILNSYAKGDVSVRSNRRTCSGGGLIGYGDVIEIDNSYAEGNVSYSRLSGTSDAENPWIGGLAGSANKIIINNSYAIGNVSGTDAKEVFSGGLIGRADESSTIANSYASGAITGTNRGGIMGHWKDGNNTSVYFNNTAGNMTAVHGLPAGLLGVGITEEKLRKQETFKNWDFEKIWTIDAEKNNGYPYLNMEKMSKARAEAMGSFTDSRDGKIYKTVKIGDQVWMAENLNFDTNDAKNSACYGSKPANCNKYGRLYNWESAKNACPSGWHLPSYEEWDILITAVGSSTAGTKLKASGGWKDGGNGTDAYGFAAMPGGFGSPLLSSVSYNNIDEDGAWWSASEHNAQNAFRYAMDKKAGVDKNNREKKRFLGVRCIKD